MQWNLRILATQNKLKCFNKKAYSATDNKQFYVSYLRLWIATENKHILGQNIF